MHFYPDISVIMATRNRASLLVEAVESILQQSFTNFELIIVDDASTDSTPQVLQELQEKDRRIKVQRMAANSGPGAARNEGMRQARGQYIAIMDDDDNAISKRFAIQVDLLNEQPQSGLVFSPVAWVDERGASLGVFPGIAQRGEFPKLPTQIFRLLYLESNKIPNTTIMFRRSLFEKFGGYPTTPWIGEDWYWFMKLAALDTYMLATSHFLVQQQRDRQHKSLMSSSTNFVCSAQRQVIKSIRSWLKTEKITHYDCLHRHAFSNQLVREARMWSGMRGLILCQQALILEPANQYAWDTFRELTKRGLTKLIRVTKNSHDD